MLAKIYYPIVSLIIFSCFPVYSQEVKTVMSNNPKYSDKEKFIDFTLLYKIGLDINKNIYMTSPKMPDFDSKNCLYIPDIYQSKIFVFNDKGQYIRTLGNNGEGPTDLLNPESIKIIRDTLYIYEQHKGIKVWDVTGKYIKYILTNIPNCMYINKYNEDMFCVGINNSIVNGKIVLVNTLWRYNDKLNEKYKIAYFNQDFIMNADFAGSLMVSLDSKGYLYYLEDINKHQITKYDNTGKPLLRFGIKNYKPEKLSKDFIKIRNEYYKMFNRYEEFLKKEYPPVISQIFIDSQDYVWVISGNINGWPYMDKDYMVTIDIFNSNGEYLYRYKTNIVTGVSIISNNKYCRVPTKYDDNTYVYRINYYK